MTKARMEAWITSAMEDDAVDKAMTLGASLRRVRTARKLVVLTTLSVSVKLRRKLKEIFDSVHVIGEKCPISWNLEEFAKTQALSLVLFDKCVYLSPNALVLRNCDDIFGKYSTFAATTTHAGLNGKDSIDTSVFLFTPSQAFDRVFGEPESLGKSFKSLSSFLKNNIPNIEDLDGQYNLKLNLKGKLHHGLNKNASIFNFNDVHPLDCPEHIMGKMGQEIGAIEKFAVDQYWNIYLEDVKKTTLSSTCTLLQSTYKTEPIAIVGMSFRLPGGNNVEEFWSLLAEGKNAVVPVPDHRWTKEHTYFPCKNRKIEAGFLNIPVDQFDSKFFGLSPKETEYLDPQQRLLMEVTWEALEDAMIDPMKLSGTSTGVFVGTWIHDYKDMLGRSLDVDFFRAYMGNSIASSAARLSHFFETIGPSIATESGCSSAISAVDLACKSLRNGNSNLAIAAGANLLLHSFEKNQMEYVLSPDFRCKTFDASANGFARAEGCAVLLLKTLSDAVNDGDNIWGLIRGTALTQEGVSKSYGTPTVHCESLAMELALKEAGVDPKDVSYIEAHGTGTSVGDPMEIMAINKAYSKGRTEPLLIGSVKTNVGHTEAASGITGIIKVLLSMKNEMIPKHLNLETLNPQINLDAIPAKIPLKPVPWAKIQDKPRLAGVSSFGISGTDGHAIIEEPPKISRPQLKFKGLERPLHIMKISAKSTESLDELIQKYLDIFNEKIERNDNSEIDFANLAYSANIGRATFNHRAIIVAKNFSEAAKQLKENSFKQCEVQSSGNGLCFLFTGQGSQYPNMTKQLYESSPVFRDCFDRCDNILLKKYNISIRNTIWAGTGNNEELSRTLYSQTSIFVVEYCLLNLWESWGVKPDYVLGHSLGEFAAAVAAGALDLEDALMLVAERSLLIDNLPRGKMLVIKADKNSVDERVAAYQKIQPKFWIDYAALNSPDQTVIAGDSGMIEEFSKYCEEKSLKTIVLAATHAFHSRHMDPMLDAYRKVGETVKKRKSTKDNSPKYISGMEGKIVDVNSIDADYWVRHTREKVKYMEACKAIQQEDCTLFLEVGPHPVLSALTMMNTEGQQVTCLPSIRRKEEEWITILDSLTKLYLSPWKGEIDWEGFDRFYLRSKVKLPFYPFNRKPVWMKLESAFPIVHPLIGSIMPTASNETMFQNSLTLKSTPFTLDHVIGNTVVFPGAGFLEMCLAGGHSTVQGFTEDLIKPRRPILLKTLKISSPLALTEAEICKVQTLVTLHDKQNEDEESELGYSVGVHRQADSDDGAGKWIQHASAKFLPVVPTLSKHLQERIDILGIQSSWEKWDNKNFYENLPEVGLRFGPKFQSLECGWRSEEGILASVKVPQDHQNYLTHPVIADAMIQAMMLWTSKDKMKKKLQVPVQIGEFIWLKEAESSTQFVYCASDGNANAYCILVNETGSPLAYMKNVDFIETTAKLVEGMITQQSTAMPKLWEDVWKNSRGPMQGSMKHVASLEDLDYSEDDLKYVFEKNNIPESELRFYKNLIRLTRFSVLKALYILGWSPKKLDQFSVDSLTGGLNIKKNFSQYIQFFMRSLTKQECGPLLRTLDEEERTFQFLVDPPTREELEEGLRYIPNSSDTSREDYVLIMSLDKVLSKILTGEVDPLTILFPEDSSNKPSAAKFYESGKQRLHVERPFLSKIRKHITTHVKLNENDKSVPNYRVLEVGAGTGVMTKMFLGQTVKVTNETGCDTSYLATDVSAAFFTPAAKLLQDYLKYVHFQKYDMEKDPLEQGLCPGYFDFISAGEVLHIAKDIKKTLKSLRSLLKPGGLLLIEETVCPDERITFIFGLLDGYWNFEDKEFRRFHTTLTPKMWEEALTESGFHGVTIIPAYNNVHGAISAYGSHDQDLMENMKLLSVFPQKYSWIIFGDHNNDVAEGLRRKIANVNRKCFVVPKPKEFTEGALQKYFHNALTSGSQNGMIIEGIVYLWSLSPNTRDQKGISLPFLTLNQLTSDLKYIPKVFAVMQGASAIETSEVTDPTPGTLIGFCKSLSNENVSVNTTYLDLDPRKTQMEQLDELFMNLWVEHKQGAAFRDGLRLRPRLSAGKVNINEPLTLPNGCERFQLVLPKTKLISDLEFAYLEPYTIGDEHEVEIQVKAMALNFRDVFAVLKPIPLFEKINTVGLDFTGVVIRAGKEVTKVKVGDRVMGMIFNDNLSLPSHYKVHEEGLVLLPESMTFAEGVTLPAVFCTSVYCLMTVAKMKKGETVLIHTASGGVGLAAIQVCKNVGANVIATAGSPRKRKYLRNLGIKHVFHSRNTDFKNQILEVTGGRGVDIVLNSITGPGFKEASLDVLCENGRFIEMSKLNVWSKEDVKALRPDVFYEQVDLTTLEPHDYKILTDQLRDWIKNGTMKPISYERFDALNIRGALNYLQKAKHIGKVVVIMPEVKLERSKLTAVTPLFNEDSTYLVTGGLGGIGFEVVKWMLNKGAKHIAIVSRSTPKREIALQIEAWNKAGKHVQAFAVDVGDYGMCKALFEELKMPELGFPQIRGVMHAAGVLQDAVLENQSWEKFQMTYNPKVNGSWNLHDLTKDFLLEHFVLFSSIAATFGTPGQGNHSASNAFEDCLAAYRRSNGLPATVVNWGNWGEVGVAKEIDLPGIRPISTRQGLLALETFLKTQTNHICVANVDSFSMALQLFPQMKHYLDDLKLFGDAKASIIMNSDEFWNEVDSATDREGKVDCFKRFIKTVVRNILKMDADEPINNQTEFQTLGIDSLMMLEMKNGMQNILGGRMTLTANQLKDCNNTEVLANTLVNILEGEFDDGKNLPTHEELKQLIREDSSLLPDSLSTNNLESMSIDQVGTVLLTGVTGNLGPYLLSDLIKRKQIQKVYCLVRPTGKMNGMERLKARLQKVNLADDVDLSKVEVMEGDIASPKFGLKDDVYLKLCENVDAVVHSAVKADHVVKYWKAPETNKSHVRTINVLGLVRLLQFAAEKRLKHFFHASTLLVFTGKGKDGNYSESWQDVSVFDDYESVGGLGYIVTKHISEQLVYEAMLRGIPCKAFRFPLFAGDSKTGRVDYEKNHAMLRWLTCMKIGAIHDLPAPISVIPVDHSAKLSLDIFFNPEAPADVYNITHKNFEVEQVLVEVAQSFGVEMEIVSYKEFLEKLKAEDENSPVAPFTKFYLESESEILANFNSPSAQVLKRFWEGGDEACMDTSRITRYAPEYEQLVENSSHVLIRDFTYLKNEGVLEKHGICSCK